AATWDRGRCVTENVQPAATAATGPVPAPSAAVAAPSAPAGPVSVEFKARKRPVIVKDVSSNTSCTTPCMLNLLAGDHSVQIGTSEPVVLSVPANGGKFSVGGPSGMLA